jgi:hypothetical protein
MVLSGSSSSALGAGPRHCSAMNHEIELISSRHNILYLESDFTTYMTEDCITL